MADVDQKLRDSEVPHNYTWKFGHVINDHVIDGCYQKSFNL